MTPNDQTAFLAVLRRTFRVVRQPLPDAEVLGVWWTKLEPYPLPAVAAALSKHIETSEFAPTPAAILKHLPRAPQSLPDADEAWAIALPARDERETVVWTTEIAQAWTIARPVLDTDEIGARMAFRAAYRRIVDEACAANSPVVWLVSQGFDATRRAEVVSAAVRAGRLRLDHAQAVALLPDAPETVDVARDSEAAIARLHAIVDAIPTIDERLQRRSRVARCGMARLGRSKRTIALQVAAFQARSAKEAS